MRSPFARFLFSLTRLLAAEKFDEESFERKMLLCSLHSATIFLVMASLKNLNLTDTNLSVDARELAMSARQSATLYLDICLNSPVFRGALRYATNWTIIDVSFCGLLLLKLSRLFPDGVDSLSNTMNQCKELSDLLLEFPGAQRFGRTISCVVPPPLEASSLTRASFAQDLDRAIRQSVRDGPPHPSSSRPRLPQRLPPQPRARSRPVSL